MQYSGKPSFIRYKESVSFMDLLLKKTDTAFLSPYT
jgi:hypothetical protein